MTANDFTEFHKRLGISRAELCRRLGISANTGTAYALGRANIPLSVSLACAALAFNLPPYRSRQDGENNINRMD